MGTRGLSAAVTTTALAAGLLCGLSGVASADPTNPPSASGSAQIDCGTFGSGTYITNSGHSQALTWNPMFVIDGQGGLTKVIPTAYDFTIYVNGVPVFSPNVSKGSAPGAVTCQLSGGSNGVTISGTVTGNPV